MPSSIYVDPANGDVYVSDGEGAGSNRRVAVMDKTGKFLRQWQPEGINRSRRVQKFKLTGQ
jgi:DNA-binding beta-propeller fold protein YncE